MKRHRKGDDSHKEDKLSPDTRQNPVNRSSNGSMLSFMMQSANLSGLFTPSASDRSSVGADTTAETPPEHILENNRAQNLTSGTYQDLISSTSALKTQPGSTSTDAFGPEIGSVWTRHPPQKDTHTPERSVEATKIDGPPLTWDYSEDLSKGYRESEHNEDSTQWMKALFNVEFGMDTPHPPPTVEAPNTVRFDTTSPPNAAWKTPFEFPVKEIREETIQSIVTASNERHSAGQEDRTWAQASPSHRPGYSNKIPPIPNGIAIYDTGSKESIQSNGAWVEDRSKGVRADIFNKDGMIVGEWKDDGWRSHGRLGQYFWSTARQEDTARPQSDSGRNSMAATANKNGPKNEGSKTAPRPAVEEGAAFSNGVEKLSHYFDHGSDGIIRGPEMSDLTLWADDKTNSTAEEGFQSLEPHETSEIRIPVAGIMPRTNTPFI